jgi:16S rRNA (guanine(966)-N(2))-methyltransferase RsmD
MNGAARACAAADRRCGNALDKRVILAGAPSAAGAGMRLGGSRRPLADSAAAVVTLAARPPSFFGGRDCFARPFLRFFCSPFFLFARMPRSSSASRSPSAAPARGKPHTVRIIGGDWKRTPLQVLDLDGLRPTPDRVRETLFNWLGQRLDGLRCLDLFAGTGALGFEAASRGAARVLMVERNAKAAHQLREIRTRLSAQAVEVVEADGLRLAAGLTPRSFDVVFLDPPFGEPLVLARALQAAAPLIAEEGHLYVESGASLELAEIDALAGWRVARQGKAGAVHYYLLRRENDE